MTDDHGPQTRPGIPAPRIRDASFSGGPPRADRTSASPAAETGPAARPPGSNRRPALIGLAIAVAALLVGAVALTVHKSPAVPTAAVTTATDGIGGLAPTLGANEDQVKALLKRRSQALATGDEAAWVADIDPTRTDIIAKERMRFTNLRLLGLKSYDLVDYSAIAYDTGKLTVGELMQLGADVERSETVADWSLAYDGKRLTITYIGPDTAGYNENLTVPRPPWDDVPLRSVTAGNVTIIAAASGRWNPAAYLPAAEKAAALVRSLWAKRAGVPGFVVFLGDHAQFTSWLEPAGVTLTNAVGVTTFPQMVEADGRQRFPRPNFSAEHGPVSVPQWLERNAGSRIVLDMTAMSGTRQVEQTLAHEMTHAMSPNLIETQNLDFGKGAGPSVVNQATWPIEGFARYVEYLDNPSYAAQTMRFVREKNSAFKSSQYLFPPSQNFYSTNGDRMEYNYDLSSSMFLAAQQSGGRQKAVDLYIALTNSGESLTLTQMFLDVSIEGVGLSPAKVWAARHALTGL